MKAAITRMFHYRDPGGRGQTLHPALACTMSRNDPDGARSPFARYEFGRCRIRSVREKFRLVIALAIIFTGAYSDASEGQNSLSITDTQLADQMKGGLVGQLFGQARTLLL